MMTTRVSDEWLIGATVGAYLVVTFVVQFWGPLFLHPWCINCPYPSDPAYLEFLIPATVVGVFDWVQIQLPKGGSKPITHSAVRLALWLNLIGILGFLVVVAAHYGPDRAHRAPFEIITLASLVCWPLGYWFPPGT